MKRIIVSLSVLSILSFVSPAVSDSVNYTSVPPQDSLAALVLPSFNDFLEELYDDADLKGAGLSYEVFKRAATGYYNLKDQKKLKSTKNILSIVDFGKPSSKKRFWIVDLDKKKVLHKSLVAHGQGSGNDMATAFSNTVNSHMSSLGFYVTENPYYGQHGLSLKLSGLDKGYNTNAKERAIVVHGADYVSEKFVKQHGRLGRSHGCPALPNEITPEVITLIKGGTCLYIDAPSSKYTSAYLNPTRAIKSFESEILAKHRELLGK